MIARYVLLRFFNIESLGLWHERLDHVNFETVMKMVNLNMIPKSKSSSHS